MAIVVSGVRAGASHVEPIQRLYHNRMLRGEPSSHGADYEAATE